MELKASQILGSKEILSKIASNNKLPTRTAYQIYLMLKKVETSLEFVEKKRMELFREYGEERGDQLVIPKEKITDFEPKLEELLSLPISEEINPVDISLDVDLGISPADIKLLEPFINFID